MRARGALTCATLGAVAFLAPRGTKAQSAPAASPVVPGIEVALGDSSGVLAGKRVGLITNHTARDRAGNSTADLLLRAPGVRLTALFGPEHGIRGVARGGDHIASARDSATGLPVYSLYGRTLVPTPEMLRDVDVLVYDVQDVGTRAYTYVWTMALAAEAASRLGKRFVVLDRPDPIRADRVEGGVLRRGFQSFTGRYPVALRYGLTPGELLRYLVGTGQVKADVTVIPARGYRRSSWYDATGLAWVSPSPNIPTAESALLYAGIVFFEATNVSEGRGTGEPFHLVGASWLTDAPAAVAELEALRLPGVRFSATRHAVAAGEKFGGRTIPMIRITVTDRDALRPADVAVQMLRVIRRRHPRDFRWQRGNGLEELAGSRLLRRAVEANDVAPLLRTWAAESDRFARETEPYWLYPR